VNADQADPLYEDIRTLERIREDVRRLCGSSDDMLRPQYRHLLGRVEALLVILGHSDARTDEADFGKDVC
jgi:hypothetical protein